ncbi:hypothetical protein [Pseudonocardia xishanensis]|uniref:Dolichyl-phosphate-mannose-protein mannosyltransferase n=1 Tax=Pseudonocardia xishanensis TaxID=630995 RepID=A0ABP8RMP6_9PSEU
MSDRATPAGGGRGAAVAPRSHVPLPRACADPLPDVRTGPLRAVAPEPPTRPVRRVVAVLERPAETPSRSETTGRHRRRAPRTGRWELVVAGVVLAGLSWMVMTWPFRGDQAIFSLIGRQVVGGQTLYVDLWDVKQPGIFLWYGLFGFDELGMRALDVAMAFAFGAVVWGLLRRRTGSARLRRLLPFLATGVLLLAAGPGDFGQLEMLCLVPAVGAFALVAADPDRVPGLRRIALAGLCVGVVGVFKLLLAGVVGVALLVHLGFTLRRHRIAAGVVLTAASFVPVLAVLGWLATQGALRETLHVWIVEAARMGAAPGSRSVSRIAEGLGRYVAWMFPVVALAGWRAAGAWRRRDALDLAMIAFVVADVVAIATQFAWWYQWYFASAPLVVLALRALGSVRWRPRTAAVVGVLCLPMLAHAGSWVLPTLLDGGGLTAASRERIDERVADYDTLRTEIAAAGLRPGDSLYVLGDPLYNRLSGTPLTVRFDGWTYDLMSDDQWSEVAAEVATTRPSVVLVDAGAAEWVADRGRAVGAELSRDYLPYRTSEQGTWYRLR